MLGCAPAATLPATANPSSPPPNPARTLAAPAPRGGEATEASPAAEPSATPAAIPAATRSAAQTLTRGPYLALPTTTSMTIVWRTAEAGDSRVEYGTTQEYKHQGFDPTPTPAHVITLTGLTAGTTYQYRISSGGAVLAHAVFRTAPDEDHPDFTFVALGDSGGGGSDQFSIAGLIGRLTPDLVMNTGDVVYETGAEADMDAKYFTPYARLLPSIPFFQVLGNHDVVAEGGAPYLRNFLLPSNNPEHTERYYSFDYGNAHWIGLDSNTSLKQGTAQRAWLEKDLAATTRFWKIVVFHHPPYSSGPVHGSDVALRNELGPLFEKHNVDLVLNGHEHNYERTTPRRDYVPASRGVVYIVTGAGGRSLYPVGKSSFTAAAASVYHVVRAVVAGCRLSLDAIQPNDVVFDHVELNRCP